MDMLFFEAANKVLNMYDRRQASAKYSPANSESEIQWGSEILSTLASVAAYTGCPGSVVIRSAAKDWCYSGVRPSDFIQPLEGDKQ